MKKIKKKSLYINIIKRKTFPFSRSRVHGDLSRLVPFGFRFVKRQLAAVELSHSTSLPARTAHRHFVYVFMLCDNEDNEDDDVDYVIGWRQWEEH